MSRTPEALPPSPPSAMTSVDSIDYLKQYIDASAGSANRTRFVLIVMVTASVLSLLAVWNSRRGNMTLSRLIVATNAQKFYDDSDVNGKTILPYPTEEKTYSGPVWDKFFSKEKYDGLKTQKEKDDYRLGKERDYDQAKRIIEANRFADLKHIKSYVEYLERTRIERVVNVSIPFFGGAFDVNDLGVFAGASFIIILLLFRFSLFRELRNVRLVFKTAKTVEQLELCYNRLAMQQVLTNPPPLDMPFGKAWHSGFKLRARFWDNVSNLLIILPLFAHIMIFWNDYRTLASVRGIYPGVVFSQWVSGVFLAVNALLTLACFSLSRMVVKSWWNHANYILRNRTVIARDLAEDEDGQERRELEPTLESTPNGAPVETVTTLGGTDKG